jgi:putative Holliday junction resolvase
MDPTKDTSERIIAIDYGEKRIGIAVSDPLKMFPIPLATISNDKFFEKNFKDILNNYNVIKIIIGYPLKEDGSESNLSKTVEKFKDRISMKYKIETELVDERYSSALAWEQILESVPSKKKRRDKSLVDMNAAAIILEDYLKER